MVSQYFSRNNSILYSGLLVPLNDAILIFAGTVFSEVIVQSAQDDQELHVLKGHKVSIIHKIKMNKLLKF